MGKIIKKQGVKVDPGVIKIAAKFHRFRLKTPQSEGNLRQKKNLRYADENLRLASPGA